MTEERKLIRLGNSSFAIALPKEWVDKSGLKKGEKVHLEKSAGGELIISASAKSSNGDKKFSIDISNLDDYSVEKEMRSAYVNGYGTLHFKGENHKELRKKIMEIGRDLLSFEVVEEGDNELIAKDFLDLNEVKVDNFIRRMDNNIRESFDSVLSSINAGKMTKPELEEIRRIDKDVNKFYLLLSRVLFKGLENPSVLSTLKIDGLELFNRWWFSYNLEHIGDCLKTISKIMAKCGLKDCPDCTGKEIKEFLEEIKELYSTCMHCFYNKDRALAHKAMKQSKELFEKHRDDKNLKQGRFSKVMENLKHLQDACYQNLKMILYMGF